MNYAITELSTEELDHIGGAGEVGDAIRAVGDYAAKLGDAAYDAGYRLGQAVASLF